jgi:hypothetical protein
MAGGNSQGGADADFQPEGRAPVPLSLYGTISARSRHPRRAWTVDASVEPLVYALQRSKTLAPGGSPGRRP